ncbi:cytochrome P450 [Xylariaceae sp. FL1651]|nr:cytochrome P450 [Xylariaceae sp. FL1651]
MFYNLSACGANLMALSLLLIAVLWRWYTIRRDNFIACQKRDAAQSIPLNFPYIFPLLGSLPVTYMWKPRDFVLSRSNFFQCTHPVLVKIFTQEFYVIRGPENVKALFKNSWVCTPIPFVKFALGHAFGLPAKARSLYDKGDSGGGHVPHPDSKVEARNRIDYRVHQSLIQFLEGRGFLSFWNRFAHSISQQLHTLHDRIGSDWVYHADLMQLVGDEAMVSTLDAPCGPYLLSLNPHFLQDFWDFDRNLQTYLQGVPWFLAPRADHYNDIAVEGGGDEPLWGSSFFRERQKMFLEMDGFDYAAITSQDFGAKWAARNSITAASWAIFDIYRDPELLASVRAEVDACALTSINGRIHFDVDRLLRLPILQAVYAETLRLRMHFYIIRMPDKADMNIRDWVIPRRKVIVTPMTVAHMDSKVWDTGLGNEHPVDRFWVGRFLKYPPKSAHVNTRPHGAASSPVFSTKDLEGSWIPYGGGPRQCPGRHFAKRQILLTTALTVSLFDCEISEEGRDMQEDFTLKGFGSGVSHPAGKVPIKIRRRDVSSIPSV